MTIFGWHFLDHRGLTPRSGRPVPPDGEWLVYEGPVTLFENGLYACERVLDVLKFAPPRGILTRVEVGGEIIRGENTPDQFTGTRRRILWRLGSDTAAAEIVGFARKLAYQALGDGDRMPTVREFLRTHDERLRVAARREAWERTVRETWLVDMAAFHACEDARADDAIREAQTAIYHLATASGAEHPFRDSEWYQARNAEFEDLLEGKYGQRSRVPPSTRGEIASPLVGGGRGKGQDDKAHR